VTLGHIHEVVMDIIELAEEHGGAYDGWGAPVESKQAD
jgi:regulator of RNase E activity RraB